MKAVLVHGVLALVGLLLAYQTWTRKPEDEAVGGEALVAECSLAQLEKIELVAGVHDVLVEPVRQRDETQYWITTRRAKAASSLVAPDAGTPALPEIAQPKRFLAKTELDKYLKRFTPLRAERSLGVLAKSKLADFGFEHVDTRLSLTCGGKLTELEVGARTFGSGERYMRDVKTQTTYLFDDGMILDLQGAQYRFMQTDLHTFAASEVDEVTVDVRGVRKHLLQRDRKQPDRALWVDAAQPARRNELYGNWFGRVQRLRVQDFLPQGAEPGSDLKGASATLTPVVTIDYTREGKSIGKLELVRADAGSEAHFYARSEIAHGWVRVFDSNAKDVEQDAAAVAGVAGAEPAKAAPSAAHPAH